MGRRGRRRLGGKRVIPLFSPLEPRISLAFHSFLPIFGRVVVSPRGLEVSKSATCVVCLALIAQPLRVEVAWKPPFLLPPWCGAEPRVFHMSREAELLVGVEGLGGNGVSPLFSPFFTLWISTPDGIVPTRTLERVVHSCHLVERELPLRSSLLSERSCERLRTTRVRRRLSV